MSVALEGYKGIILCHRYECSNCGHVFYWPADFNMSTTSAVSIPICPKCNSYC